MNCRKTAHQLVLLAKVKASSDCSDGPELVRRDSVLLRAEVIATGTKISRAENSTRRDFPFQVEIILQRVGELRMVSRRDDIQWLHQDSLLRVEECSERPEISISPCLPRAEVLVSVTEDIR